MIRFAENCAKDTVNGNMKFFQNSSKDKLAKAKKIISRYFERAEDDFLIEPITGGASTREYFRVIIPRLPTHASGVLMLQDKRFNLADSDFYQVADLLRRLNLPAPMIYQEFSKDGAFYLQDLGIVHLHDLVAEVKDDDEFVASLYEQAIDHLIVLQTRAKAYSKGIKAFERAFDQEKLLWEMDFMLKHFASSFASWAPGKAEKDILDKFFGELVSQIAALPRVLCHRDYHSKNLLLWNEQLFIIDFQDARMGPHVYDLVSLLGDSYVEIGSGLRHRLISYYADKHPEFDQTKLDLLFEQYSLVAIQRHLKHLGTFGYLESMGDKSSVQYIPGTIAFIEDNLAKFPETKDAALILRDLFRKAESRVKEGEQ